MALPWAWSMSNEDDVLTRLSCILLTQFLISAASQSCRWVSGWNCAGPGDEALPPSRAADDSADQEGSRAASPAMVEWQVTLSSEVPLVTATGRADARILTTAVRSPPQRSAAEPLGTGV